MTAAKTQTAAGSTTTASPHIDWTNLTLEDALDLDFAGWNPEPGAKLVGTVLYVVEAVDSEFGPYPMIGVATDDGEAVNVHCFHTVLRNGLERWKVSPGDRIAIKYKGAREGGSFGSYSDYNVIVQKAGQAALQAPAAALGSGA